MGRYYDGDIEGKFWFGVQSSTAPERFGCRDDSDNYIHYSIDDSEIEQVEEGLQDCLNELQEFGITKEFCEYYLDNRTGFSHTLQESCQKFNVVFPKDETLQNKVFSNLADYELGKKILNCLKENGYCEFRAEL